MHAVIVFDNVVYIPAYEEHKQHIQETDLECWHVCVCGSEAKKMFYVSAHYGRSAPANHVVCFRFVFDFA